MHRQLYEGYRRIEQLDTTLCTRILAARKHHRSLWVFVRFVARYGPHLFFFEMVCILLAAMTADVPWTPLAVKGIVVAVVAALCTKVVIDQIGKRVMRKRPFVRYEFAPLLPKDANEPSFPSNHAGGAFALGVALSLSFPALSLLSLLLAITLASARVLAGLHYLSDVVTGAVIGFTFAVGMTLLAAHI